MLRAAERWWLTVGRAARAPGGGTAGPSGAGGRAPGQAPAAPAWTGRRLAAHQARAVAAAGCRWPRLTCGGSLGQGPPALVLHACDRALFLRGAIWCLRPSARRGRDKCNKSACRLLYWPAPVRSPVLVLRRRPEGTPPCSSRWPILALGSANRAVAVAVVGSWPRSAAGVPWPLPWSLSWSLPWPVPVGRSTRPARLPACPLARLPAWPLSGTTSTGCIVLYRAVAVRRATPARRKRTAAAATCTVRLRAATTTTTTGRAVCVFARRTRRPAHAQAHAPTTRPHAAQRWRRPWNFDRAKPGEALAPGLPCCCCCYRCCCCCRAATLRRLLQRPQKSRPGPDWPRPGRK